MVSNLVECVTKLSRGAGILGATIFYYGDGIFFPDFLVHPSGMVEMVDDLPIMSGLKDTVDAPINP